MELVVDANIIFSALIKEGKTIELLFKKGLTLYSPDFIITEILKYEELILQKTKRSRGEISQLMHTLQKTIEVVPQEEFLSHAKEAADLSPDEKDIAYVALALRLNCPVWSNDKALKQQDKVTIYNTGEVLDLLHQ